jgi:3-methylcrotonyl-CoA carboxylase alpha subunit
VINGWRLNDQGWDELVIRERDTETACHIEYLSDGTLKVSGPGGSVVVSGQLDTDGNLDAVIDGRRQRAGLVRQEDEITLLLPGETHRLGIVDPRAAADLDEGGSGQLTAPMPGKVVQALVEDGTKVEKGQALMILEAMKMEHTISAPARGTVAKVHFRAGDQVSEGAVLLTLDAED